jgi:hypothetical protein
MQLKSKAAVLLSAIAMCIVLLFVSGCKKSQQVKDELSSSIPGTIKAPTPANPPFNLEAILAGPGSAFGHVKFRQDNDVAKIVTLGVWVRDLEPNHQYQLQRAVDTNLDGNCTSTTWLTLGKGLQPQTITTDDSGTGTEELWRDLSAVAVGTSFDIHFQVIDAVTKAVVLSSDCYRFTVR